MASRHRLSLLALATLASLLGTALPVLAQPNLRSTFPGRRVGGATRGECSSRLIAHLVPTDSVYAAGDTRLLGLLEGPTANPHPVQVSFQPAAASGAPLKPAGSSDTAATTLTLPASAASVVLLRQPASSQPLRWESTYQCEAGTTSPSDDPLTFIAAVSPPAISLLLAQSSAEFKPMQQALQQLYKSCGASVPREQVAASFGMGDLITADWPAQLPVRCIN